MEGEIIDKTPSATFDVGDGSLLPGFESAMFGMKAGESASHEIAAKHGFGEPNEDNVHKMKRINFNDLDLAEGLVVSFKDGEGNELPGVVKDIGEELVLWTSTILSQGKIYCSTSKSSLSNRSPTKLLADSTGANIY